MTGLNFSPLESKQVLTLFTGSNIIFWGIYILSFYKSCKLQKTETSNALKAYTSLNTYKTLIQTQTQNQNTKL
jgi:hypothetical protein